MNAVMSESDKVLVNMLNGADDDVEETLIVGKYYVLKRCAFCYKVLTADDGKQVFGSYDLDKAKQRYVDLERQMKEMIEL